ncbi:MAG: sulfatase-like hydrolase/transferase [Caldilineaceae bacterium]|nr:sulfatase-like hydrolase/transferase [Caldilineaceae bacterium]
MNFVIFQPDELRAESVGCYGHPLAPTPNIDRLAAQGTRFDQCHVQHTVCTPSRCSMMTGWHPHVRGHRTLWHLLRPDEPNMLKYLKQAGYTVLCYGKNDLFAEASFADSVTEYRRFGKGLFGKNRYNVEDPRYYSFLFDPYEGPLAEHGDYANTQAAIRFLRSQPQEPFIIFLPLTYPHCPYSAPQPYHDLINPDDLPALRPANLPNRPDFHQLIRQYRRIDQINAAAESELLRKIQAVYLGMTGFIDELLGQVMDVLDETGLADTTTLTFTSDHGDYAGDYGLVEKWPSAAEDIVTRVPLIVRTPGGKAGHVVNEPMELFDLMPTTLAQANVDVQHTHFARSYVAELGGAAGDPTRAAFTEGGYARHEPHNFEGLSNRDQFARDAANIYYPKGLQQQEHPDSVGRSVAMRTTTHRMVYRPTGQGELYDMAADPQELNNVHGQPAYADIQRQLERRLLEWYVQTSDVTPFDMDPRGLPS